MKHTQEEILNALHVIHDVCKGEEDCVSCPFSLEMFEDDKNPNCYLLTVPVTEWEIKEPEKIWRAFECD